ncbi:MAG TPA: histidine phosphatase family protein [Candidatus Lustribacter sp.]|nr:histidine phosphatase family protein [Candidatus Lustribacter sp.]
MTGRSPAVRHTRRVVVLRHGETTDNAANIWQGHRDSELSERGLAQAAAAAPVLACYRPALIVSSDLSRAARTATALAAVTGLPVRLDERLREVHVGQWQGRSGPDIHAEYPELVTALGRGEDIRRGVTGETVADVAVRVGAALDDVVASLGPGETAIVSTHGVASRAAVAGLCGIGQMEAFSWLQGLGNCHWAVVVESRPGLASGGATPWRIEGWNLSATVAVGDLGGPGASG